MERGVRVELDDIAVPLRRRHQVEREARYTAGGGPAQDREPVKLEHDGASAHTDGVVLGGRTEHATHAAIQTQDACSASEVLTERATSESLPLSSEAENTAESPLHEHASTVAVGFMAFVWLGSEDIEHVTASRRRASG